MSSEIWIDPLGKSRGTKQSNCRLKQNLVSIVTLWTDQFPWRSIYHIRTEYKLNKVSNKLTNTDEFVCKFPKMKYEYYIW